MKHTIQSSFLIFTENPPNLFIFVTSSCTGMRKLNVCNCICSGRLFIRKSKRRKHPNNVIIEGRFGIVVPKATTAVSNFLTMCAVVDSS
jgi:hypothetical protein